MGIDPNDVRFGEPVSVPDPTPVDMSQPVPPDYPPAAPVPSIATAESGEVSSPAVADKDDDVMAFYMSGYFEALKREFEMSQTNAKDHARGVLAEMRLVDQEAFKAFVDETPAAKAIIGAAVRGTAPSAK